MVSIDDIDELRAKGRNQEFCLLITRDAFEEIVEFTLKTKLTLPQISSLLATISNILLINSQRHVSNEFVTFLTSLIDATDLATVECTLLVPIYRLLFLMLSDKSFDILDTELTRVNHTLEQSLYTLGGSGMVEIEILKALYTIQSNYSLDTSLVQHCQTRFITAPPEMARYLLNVITLSPKKDPEFITALLNYLSVSKDTSDTLIILTIINKMNKEPSERRLEDGPGLLSQGILPNKSNSLLYNKFMSILGTFTTDRLTSMLKTSILECFYTLSEDLNEFLVLVGYLVSREYLDANEIDLGDVDIVKYMRPTSPYLKQSLDYTRLETDFVSTMNKLAKDMNTTESDMSLEEKEIEAERLFVIFDRMEKTGVFEGFKNPVREWQEQGRFENIDDDNDD